MTCPNPCFNSQDFSGKNTCGITLDTTPKFPINNQNYAIVDGNGYPLNSNSFILGYSESAKQNLVGCLPNNLGKGTGSCYDGNGNIVNGYKACTEAQCKPVIYDNSFPLNQCNYAYVSIQDNYQPAGTCTDNHQTACSQPLCDPPCQNGGTCEFNASLQPVCNCNSAVLTAKDCYASCRSNTPYGNTWTFKYSGNVCEIPPPDGLPDGFITKMVWKHAGDDDTQCESYPFGRQCVNGEHVGTENDTGDCIAYGFYCGTESGDRDHSTGSGEGNCNC